MAFDHDKLTRLTGPLSFIYPQENQAQYWAYRTLTDTLDEVMADGFFPEFCGVQDTDIIILFLPGSDTPAVILSAEEI